ncbi:TPA: hypothetical protein ACG65H_003775 [Escherichia coli]|uniref:hypothetical protein n=1 Tax=Shigella sonnei TaxID=624 RepID=UPI000DA4C3B1|nr:hypothetical protein [Shigella sonnei]EBY5505860.1 hypothetical protein [Salmonella enterica subsp. enterica serovar Infantis]EDC6278292.1 hypothetical protein [Salmonella enterica subsp. enterica serovar Enteritidis]EEW1262417.1 hypothetical protein [Escherichia coli]EGS0965755.1 hypothetical protein [Salmonella enterica]HBI5688781.1 hypothetical protein [Salmonella enterica subsp. enterica serovar Welikade]
MNTYKLTHFYSRLHGFYGVRTDLNLHQLNLVCAYLQLMRYDLPYLHGAEDTIGEDSCRTLLSAIYCMEPIFEETPYSAELDLYENWDLYCGGMLHSIESEIIGSAKPNVYQAIIMSLINDCQECLKVAFETQSERDPARVSAVMENIDRLTRIAKGEAVNPAWGWRSIDGAPLDGRIFIRKDGERDLPSFLSA